MVWRLLRFTRKGEAQKSSVALVLSNPIAFHWGKSVTEIFGSSSAAAFGASLSMASAEWIARQEGNDIRCIFCYKNRINQRWHTDFLGSTDGFTAWPNGAIVLASVKVFCAGDQKKITWYKSSFHSCLCGLAARLQMPFTPLTTSWEFSPCAVSLSTTAPHNPHRVSPPYCSLNSSWEKRWQR